MRCSHTESCPEAYPPRFTRRWPQVRVLHRPSVKERQHVRDACCTDPDLFPEGGAIHLASGPALRLLGTRLGEALDARWDVCIAGREPLLRDCRDHDDPGGEQDDAARLHGSPGSEPTNAATAVPTASIGRDPEVTFLLYASCARLTRSRPLFVATAYRATARAVIFSSRFTPGA